MHTGYTDALRAQVRQAAKADHLIAEEDVLIKSAVKGLLPAGRHNQQNTAGLDETLCQINCAALPVDKYLPDRWSSAEAVCMHSAKTFVHPMWAFETASRALRTAVSIIAGAQVSQRPERTVAQPLPGCKARKSAVLWPCRNCSLSSPDTRSLPQCL